MRSAHDDLQKENESLHTQQISSAQEGFEPPCIKCIERDNVVSVAECSTATTVAISSTADVVANPSSEDTTTIADENARLKSLLETGMSQKVSRESSREFHYDTTWEEDKPQTNGFIQTEDSQESP